MDILDPEEPNSDAHKHGCFVFCGFPHSGYSTIMDSPALILKIEYFQKNVIFVIFFFPCKTKGLDF